MPSKYDLLYEARSIAEEICDIERILKEARTNVYDPTRSPSKQRLEDLLQPLNKDLNSDALTREVELLRKKCHKLDAEAELEAASKLKELKSGIEANFEEIEALLEDQAKFSPEVAGQISGLLSDIDSMVHNIDLWESVPKEVLDPYEDGAARDRLGALELRTYQLSCAAEHRDAATELLIDSIVDLVAKGRFGEALIPPLRASFEATKHLRSLVYHPTLVGLDITQAALEVKPDTDVYIIPTLALWHSPWVSAQDATDASGFSEAVLETIATLRGGDAYPTLKEAAEAAVKI